MPEEMTEQQIESLLAEAVERVMETMFFTGILGRAPEAAAEDQDCVSAQLAFRGDPPGEMQVHLPRATARSIAASFLGAEDESSLPEEQVGAVVCEMVNMICGAAVSRLEADATFQLDSPQLVTAPLPAAAPGVSRCSFELENGIITVALTIRKPA